MSPAGAIEASVFAQAMRDSLWLYPAVLFAHILGIALLFGSDGALYELTSSPDGIRVLRYDLGGDR